jgi:hypothetical protein
MTAGKVPGEADGDGTARHGARTDVNWEGGSGRQPYGNRGTRERGPATAKEEDGGDRGERSGRNLEQLEQAKQKP